LFKLKTTIAFLHFAFYSPICDVILFKQTKKYIKIVHCTYLHLEFKDLRRHNVSAKQRKVNFAMTAFIMLLLPSKLRVKSHWLLCDVNFDVCLVTVLDLLIILRCRIRTKLKRNFTSRNGNKLRGKSIKQRFKCVKFVYFSLHQNHNQLNMPGHAKQTLRAAFTINQVERYAVLCFYNRSVLSVAL